MQKVENLLRLKQAGVVAVIRDDTPEGALKQSDAVIAGGVTAIELTFTVPNAANVIQELAQKYRDDASVIIGAGTVLDPVTARLALSAGAAFIVSPSFNAEVAKMCNLYNIPYTPGCMTPTEIQRALEAGCDLVKLFPGAVMHPAMVKAVKAPFPQLSIMPTGGVALDNMAEWFAAGVTLVGAGSNLTAAAKTGDYAGVTATAKAYKAELDRIRG
ncbi:MAG: bifunctional 4-hydroxy-2-oxoglutarate aldolase/2-dehydro-3-deoxy-phosphogluconate aldolase [Lactobacillus sp.]|jgi:2-dehydro-3-deoxyphosphogluconate aldolase/(4S)-4-hydroxy-2-oxoglutarate aldolase|uniref:Bifunctional 4-hydroxy-2-oxoglutarate aldolase/2-dehydro-3-deoxy-phosphogluconate aldolase n=1 Tax=Lacticaseibacillus suilingensis TaxID=2799577 RepID=A0ABW4BHN3_9LACO|nr:bifunctional 4-hydroxy-2-oxoglutarate aldolase/2-dehydro-3-deoxy-phosphogluconate aldolase [Lacticaseibacillus suilingensis]MCI1895239.1 bifunctional 4-hydroxy-2-oxoglutarate aldolase/2-dehydro-3-deoxy-phosphogluconate aldolase [Lactobacillus sp.]MCI1917590.1 bifunctional 4-hydroxy-2-oxoglutarate aldolase/2-dehydro-3-deoxy-phosphogluconate aldolase [Lactobacillus sp.]MCI1942437.1 bifunctional 4-hydroxy-2-oxoglutarate aldolase/2-dehydro-3-deoxy-phosphogluconate aldolase [Lactobacillus sp.]MCI